MEKLNRLLSRELIQYYINNEVDGNSINNCVDKLNEIEKAIKKTGISYNNGDIFYTIKQCFEDRKALIMKAREKVLHS